MLFLPTIFNCHLISAIKIIIDDSMFVLIYCCYDSVEILVAVHFCCDSVDILFDCESFIMLLWLFHSNGMMLLWFTVVTKEWSKFLCFSSNCVVHFSMLHSVIMLNKWKLRFVHYEVRSFIHVEIRSFSVEMLRFVEICLSYCWYFISGLRLCYFGALVRSFCWECSFWSIMFVCLAVSASGSVKIRWHWKVLLDSI